MVATECKALNLQLVENNDPELAKAMFQELDRQQNKIELIASENFTSLAVMQAQGSWLTNKYAEGVPGRRYYGGCEYVDVVEQMAIDRAKALFGAEHANVQPHSGAQANMSVFLAMLQPGDTVMGMNLSQGGHLTHGSPVNFSGKYFNIIQYGVDREKERINYEDLEKLAIESSPKMIIAGASAYARIIDFERMGEIARKVGALLMVDMAHIAGLVAAGLHPSPVPHADFVTTTTHKTLRGPRGGLVMCKEKYAKEIDKAVFPGLQGGPLMHVIAAKAVALKEAAAPEFVTYQKQVVANAKAMANAFIQNGIRVASGGTDNHLMLIDLRSLKLTGKVAEHILDEVGITTNKNTIPYDPESPFVTSGIRIGTPAATARGMKEEAMVEIANIITDVLSNPENEKVKQKAKERVQTLCQANPLYPELL